MLGSPESKYYALHATPRGANDARPTALRIINDENLEGKWADKVILITGGSAFVGAETARALHATGATVSTSELQLPSHYIAEVVFRQCCRFSIRSFLYQI
jgi:hypothetical protein